jgi:hypothetical protein
LDNKTANTIVDNGKLILQFPILYDGWEMDNIGWIYEFDGVNYAIGTNHGSLYIMTSLELSDKINEYNIAIEKTRKALGKIS